MKIDFAHVERVLTAQLSLADDVQMRFERAGDQALLVEICNDTEYEAAVVWVSEGCVPQVFGDGEFITDIEEWTAEAWLAQKDGRA